MVKIQLDNGLEVDLISKPNFIGQFAVAMVDFGAVDREVVFNQQTYNLPAGIAHFIEHQLFNKQDGDISKKFAANQASTNAFTTASKTAYYFESTGNLYENLDLLGELVGTSYFKTENVDKERTIIAQEINLYQDQPDWQLDMGVLRKMYPNSPLSDDIAGTADSLELITPELLQAVYQKFYRPDKIHLSVVADFDDLKLRDYLAHAQVWQNIGIANKPTSWSSIIKTDSLQKGASTTTAPRATVGLSKLALGFRGEKISSLTDAISLQVDLELILTSLFGETSINFRKWRDKGLIDDSFDCQTVVERGYNYLLITTNTDHAREVERLVRQVLAEVTVATIANFDLVKREMQGNFLFSQDSLENLGVESAELGFYGWETSQVADYLRQAEVSSSLARVQMFFKSSCPESFQLLGEGVK